MVEKVRISALVMVKDAERSDQMWSPVGDPVDYYLPGADVETTRRTLIEALKRSGFEFFSQIEDKLDEEFPGTRDN